MGCDEDFIDNEAVVDFDPLECWFTEWLEEVKIWKKMLLAREMWIHIKTKNLNWEIMLFTRWKEDIFAESNKEVIDFCNTLKSTHGKDQDYSFIYSFIFAVWYAKTGEKWMNVEKSFNRISFIIKQLVLDFNIKTLERQCF